ncbi:hypothetical protein I317_00567 [Kwoniella heveanensis CBS 569]|nr:hypothetical protein I317_00567 [Kwoniella heveanensis CBS 569]
MSDFQHQWGPFADRLEPPVYPSRSSVTSTNPDDGDFDFDFSPAHSNSTLPLTPLGDHHLGTSPSSLFVDGSNSASSAHNTHTAIGTSTDYALTPVEEEDGFALRRSSSYNEASLPVLTVTDSYGQTRYSSQHDSLFYPYETATRTGLRQANHSTEPPGCAGSQGAKYIHATTGGLSGYRKRKRSDCALGAGAAGLDGSTNMSYGPHSEWDPPVMPQSSDAISIHGARAKPSSAARTTPASVCGIDLAVHVSPREPLPGDEAFGFSPPNFDWGEAEKLVERYERDRSSRRGQVDSSSFPA